MNYFKIEYKMIEGKEWIKRDFPNAIQLYNFVKPIRHLINIKEKWIDVDGFDGRYQISNLGNLRSNWGKRKKSKNFRPTKHGYLRVDLYKPMEVKTGNRNSNRKSLLGHCLVAQAFCYNAEPDLLDEVDHMNGYCDYNEFWNLRWADRIMNLDNRKFNDTPF